MMKKWIILKLRFKVTASALKNVFKKFLKQFLVNSLVVMPSLILCNKIPLSMAYYKTHWLLQNDLEMTVNKEILISSIKSTEK